MDNFQTIEVRWFYPGELPAEISNWFETVGEHLENIDTRSDFYLQSSSPDVGVKLRQGNLEVKYRQQELGQFTIDGMADSRIEQWSKWICMADGGGLSLTKLADKPGWLKVDKIRDRRLFRVEFGEQIALTQIATPAAEIASIELTQLQVSSQPWWTVACEYFGKDLDLDRQFLPLVRILSAGSSIATDRARVSCGYPQWLAAIA
jgi:predicted component of type VI protein secretion system